MNFNLNAILDEKENEIKAKEVKLQESIQDARVALQDLIPEFIKKIESLTANDFEVDHSVESLKGGVIYKKGYTEGSPEAYTYIRAYKERTADNAFTDENNSEAADIIEFGKKSTTANSEITIPFFTMKNGVIRSYFTRENDKKALEKLDDCIVYLESFIAPEKPEVVINEK